MEITEVWNECIEEIKKKISKQQFSTWITPLSFSFEKESHTVIISAPNQFILQWVNARFHDEIKNKFLKMNQATTIEFKSIKKQKNSQTSHTKKIDKKNKETPEKTKTTGLNKSFNFDNFVTGKANQLATAAAKQISENPGKSYNPLFIYGGVGLGKTHLIQAIGNHLKGLQPESKIKYLHAERYVSDVVKAYENKSFDSFKKQYHSLDLLLIDDIQFIAKKNRTQEEFFYAFNSLIENKKQIIITCDSYPKEIIGVDERLRTRFSWGLTVAIEPPELEMRVAILKKKAEEVNIILPEEVAFFVAKQIRSNVRELEGALNRIVAMANFSGRQIDMHLTKESLKDLIAVRGRQVSVENIQKTVADYYKIKIADMHSKKRSRNFSRPRQIAMSLTRELTNLSFPEIAEAFGGRHHTTIMHACDEIESLRLNDHNVGQDLGFLTQVLKG
ncbi:MAG: chromosomal replication initiator protein DnaA [Methylophilaceae bacterium]|nr:chromosomal replication initiator protein DnaA [Methylophilaceae bacterium]MBL6727063.1 chromosomal replication initiator protein DnaA [Methylophilaceae bacterium]MBL6790481.1 chromosomal replication initiator protein DnaA [Methylophilaceae bacterium]